MKEPLAQRIRPNTLDDIVGQKHLLDKGRPLRNIIEHCDNMPNMIFYGSSGVGKSTVATYIANKTKKLLRKLNGTTASISDIKDIVSELDTFSGMNGILLYIDEIQYFNKKQQQTLLEFLENGSITLIASTTENPYFYVYNAILSRCTVFEFKSVESTEIEKAVRRAFYFLADELHEKIMVDDNTIRYIATACGGDVRKAINSVELCVATTFSEKNTDGNVYRKITLESAKNFTQKSSMKYDKNGDEHHDLLSAFQKSMRGSDPDAGIYYLGRLLSAGDLLSVCRRLMVCACEDVGLAYPQIIPIVKSCVDIALQTGLPEARIPLADAVLLVCNAPKSNSAYNAINKAMQDIESGLTGNIPRQLQNKHFDGDEVENKGQFYLYPHDFEHHYVRQQYLPDNLKDRKYYEFGNNKNEQAFRQYWQKIMCNV